MSTPDDSQGNPEEILIAKLQQHVTLACRGTLPERLSSLKVIDDELRELAVAEVRVPRAMRHLIPFYDNLVKAHQTFTNADYRQQLGDILSFLAISCTDTSHDILLFRLSSPIKDIGAWGHDYVRCLTENLIRANSHRDELPPDTNYDDLVAQIAQYFILHNDEPCACDLLFEVGRIAEVEKFVDDTTYNRVTTYLLQCYDYLKEPENFDTLRIVLRIYLSLNKLAQAVIIALKLNDRKLIEDLYNGCDDPAVKKQLAFLLARQLIVFETETDQDLIDIATNTTLGTRFMEIAQLLELGKVRTPDDVLQLQATLAPRNPQKRISQSLTLMAKSFVSGFHNACLKEDLYYTAPRGDECLKRNRNKGLAVAVASFGMLNLWDLEAGPNTIDRWLSSENPMIRMGALTAVGIMSSAVRSEFEPALALAKEHLDSDSIDVALGAVFALSMAYAGTNRRDVLNEMLKIRAKHESSGRAVCFLSLGIGLLYVGSCNEDILTELMAHLLAVADDDTAEFYLPLLALGHGLVYLGQQRACADHIEQLREVLPEGSLGEFIRTTVIYCAYAATGNVVEIQRNLTVCIGDDGVHQAASVLGIAVMALGDPIGTQMARRTLEQVMQYGKPFARRMAPIALALTSVSAPLPELVDNLHRIGRDTDQAVAKNAGLALGLLAAGTMNTRAMTVLKTLAGFHKEAEAVVVMMHIAEGLVSLGQGTLTLSPTYGDSLILNPVALGALLVLAHAAIYADALLVSDSGDPLLFYFIAPAIAPRFLVTIDEELNIVRVPVRVGTALDVVGQAGSPRQVSGFQQLDTPVLIAAGQRAEIADDTWEPLSPLLEGFVIVRKKVAEGEK